MPTENAVATVPLSEARSPFFDWRFVYWCGLFVCGFAYVAMALCRRSTPFASGKSLWGDWLGVMLSVPTLYLLASRYVLREFGPKPKLALLWNCLVYGGLFFAALHWEWVGKLTNANFSLTARQLSHLNGPSQIACVVGITIIAAMTTLCLREARREGILKPYLLSFAGLVLALVITTCALGPGYHMHIHHYFFTLCLLPFVRFRHPVCLITQAMLAGVYVEGACRWGLDPIWVAGR